jgi:hypothetical protein
MNPIAEFEQTDILAELQELSPSGILDEQTEKMILLLFEVGADHRVIASILDGLLSAPPELTRYLGGAIIVHDSDWGRNTPERAITAAIKTRLQTVLKEMRDGIVTDLATPAEVMCFMYGQTMVAPMTNKWANIYQACFVQTAVEFNWMPSDLLADLGKPSRDVEDCDCIELRRWIRKQVVASGLSRGYGKKPRKGISPVTPPKTTSEAATKPIQYSLFS